MIRTYFRNQRGAAAVEFALMLGVFTVSLPSVVDLGIYAYDKMQVQNSAQMGAQAIWAACTSLPATDATSCPTAQTAVNAAVQRTSLGSAVTVSSVTEGYYCSNASGVLTETPAGKTGNFTTALDASTVVPTPPTTCPTGSQTSSPGEYIWVTVSYTYSPVFTRASVASLLPTTIQSRGWMRLI
jgi:Flp pilus assembly protein TadG